MHSYSSLSLKWLPLCIAAFFLCSASSPAYADANVAGTLTRLLSLATSPASGRGEDHSLNCHSPSIK